MYRTSRVKWIYRELPGIIRRSGACNSELIINNSRNYVHAASEEGETRENEAGVENLRNDMNI